MTTRSRCLLMLLMLSLFLTLPLRAAQTPVLEELSVPTERHPLAERLESVYAKLPGFEGVEVNVNEGVVHLDGEVGNEAAREHALGIARSLAGDMYVLDDLLVAPEPVTRLAELLSKVSEMGGKMLNWLPSLLVVAIVMLLAGLLIKLLSLKQWNAGRFLTNPMLRHFIQQLVSLGILLGGLLISLEILGLSSVVGALLGMAGLMGLAVGFAFRDILENYLAGMLLSVRSPFTVNDWVEVDTYAGSVVRLTSRELVLMTLEGNHIRLPNSHVFKSPIINYTRNPFRGFVFSVGVGVDADLSLVQQVGCGALRKMESVLDDPTPTMRVDSLGDFNVVVSFRGWVDQRSYEYLKVQSEAIRMVKMALEINGVDMPIPQQTLFLRRPEEEGERPRNVPADDLDTAVKKADVHRESFLDQQIELDRAQSGEQNLLEPESKGKGRD